MQRSTPSHAPYLRKKFLRVSSALLFIGLLFGINGRSTRSHCPRHHSNQIRYYTC